MACRKKEQPFLAFSSTTIQDFALDWITQISEQATNQKVGPLSAAHPPIYDIMLSMCFIWWLMTWCHYCQKKKKEKWKNGRFSKRGTCF